jgi:PAS domain-containing protein
MPIESQKPTILEDQRILEALSEIGVYITNYKTEETLISKTWKDIPDRFQVKQISPDFLSHIHPDDREQLARDLDSIKKGVSSNFNCIFRMKDSSGKYKWIKSKGKTVHSDEDGLPILFVGFDTDISELKKTEKKLLNRFLASGNWR